MKTRNLTRTERKTFNTLGATVLILMTAASIIWSMYHAYYFNGNLTGYFGNVTSSGQMGKVECTHLSTSIDGTAYFNDYFPGYCYYMIQDVKGHAFMVLMDDAVLLDLLTTEQSTAELTGYAHPMDGLEDLAAEYMAAVFADAYYGPENVRDYVGDFVMVVNPKIKERGQIFQWSMFVLALLSIAAVIILTLNTTTDITENNDLAGGKKAFISALLPGTVASFGLVGWGKMIFFIFLALDIMRRYTSHTKKVGKFLFRVTLPFYTVSYIFRTLLGWYVSECDEYMGHRFMIGFGTYLSYLSDPDANIIGHICLSVFTLTVAIFFLHLFLVKLAPAAENGALAEDKTPAAYTVLPDRTDETDRGHSGI